jgi:hypothetical protein
VTVRLGKRGKQLLDGLRDMRRYCNWNSKHQIAHWEEPTVEESMDLSWDRIRKEIFRSEGLLPNTIEVHTHRCFTEDLFIYHALRRWIYSNKNLLKHLSIFSTITKHFRTYMKVTCCSAIMLVILVAQWRGVVCCLDKVLWKSVIISTAARNNTHLCFLNVFARGRLLTSNNNNGFSYHCSHK